MKRIEFSELTSRLHRNAMLAASLIIGITYFQIDIKKASSSGVEFDNLTTAVILVSLGAVLMYHAFAFYIRAFEEYREWELKLVESETSGYGGDISVIDLAAKLRQVADLLDKVLGNGGVLRQNNQVVFSRNDADQLNDVVASAEIYSKRFANFPKITRFRFWFWDVGVTTAVVGFSAYTASRYWHFI